MSDEQTRADGETQANLRESYIQANDEGRCVFCPPDPAKNPPVYGDIFEHWNVWHNPRGEPGALAYIMLAPKEHVTYRCQLPPEARAEYDEIEQRLAEDYGPCYSLVSRVGATPELNTNASRIYGHFNVQFVVGGKPIPDDAVTQEVVNYFKGDAPEAAVQMLAQLYDRLWSEAPLRSAGKALTEDDRREWVKAAALNLLLDRDREEGKAWTIVFKLSNQVNPSFAG